MQFIGSHSKPLAKATVDHDSDHVQLLATVGIASPAGITLAAVHVRLDAASISWLDAEDTVADFQDFHSEFVPGDARVSKEGHLTEVATVVRTADSHSMRPHKRFARTRRTWVVDFDTLKVLGFFQADSAHGFAPETGCDLTNLSYAS
jgi:hypothetical protein